MSKKTKKTILYILMFLPLAVTLAVLPMLPEQIPAHYGFDFQVDRWGSKYEALIYPVTTILFGLFMLGMAKLAARQEESGKNNENVCILTGIALLLFFNVMTGYSLYTDFERVENLADVSIDMYGLIFAMTGVVMIIIGNIMPKLRMNSVSGLRTVWSMKNETTWKKSQRFGGISLMTAGTLILVVSCFVRGIACAVCALGILTVVLAVDVCYTYRVAQKY